ncbi:MAG: hypothetical protein C0614_04840 [Desulfuromonas sp.]|nr:MAG: hypothetical protein C0614_04840 [Desulfuromonas sp.]
MAQPMAARSYRGRDRKYLVWTGLLLISFTCAGFGFGYVYGRQTVRSVPSSEVESMPVLAAKQVEVPPRPALKETTVPQSLSFYEDLPKGQQAPLGSGINLPPDVVALEMGGGQSRRVEDTGASAISTEKKPSVKPFAAAVDADGSFMVQVASFRAEQDARKLIERIGRLKVTASVERADLGDKGVWFRVISGPYRQRREAEQVRELLKERERLAALVRGR